MPVQASGNPPSTAERRLFATQSVWLVAWAAFLAVAWAFWGAMVLSDREVAVNNVRSQATATARLMADHAERLIEGSDSLLQWVADQIRTWDLQDQVAGRQHWQDIRRHIQDMPQVRSVWILDGNGDSVLQTVQFPAPPTNLSHRSYFRAHFEGASNPVLGHSEVGSETGDARFTVSRAVFNPDGTIRAVLNVGISTGYLAELYREADVWDSARLALRLIDGATLAQWPAGGELAPELLNKLGERVMSVPRGTDLMTVDDTEYIVAWHSLSAQPAYAVVTQDRAAALQQWRDRAITSGFAVLSASSALSFLVLLGLRAARAERHAIIELQHTNMTLDRRVEERTRELLRTETRLRASQELSPDGFMILWAIHGREGEIQDFSLEYANPAAMNLFNERAPSLQRPIGRRLLQRFFKGRAEEVFRRCVRVVESGQGDNIELDIEDSHFRGFFRIVMTKVDDGIAIHFTDITARKRAADALRASETAMRRHLAEIEAVYATAPVGLCVFDRDLHYVRVNDRLAEINGVPAEQHIGRSIAEVVPGMAAQAMEFASRVLAGESVIDAEMTGETPAQPGMQRVWQVSWFPLKDELGQIVGINVVAEEITERKRIETRTHQLLERNAMLLREIHHRVKNNLQLVASLLNIQARAITDAGARSQFEALQRRVRAIAGVHETIYRTEDFENVELCGLLRGLCDDLVRSAGTSRQIAVEGKHDVYVSSEKAVAVALVVNELVTNALKHAGNDGGRVVVRLTMEEDRTVIVRIEDNGPGLPPGFDLQRPQGFGLKMALALTGQANGTLVRVPADVGAVFELRLPGSETRTENTVGNEAGR